MGTKDIKKTFPTPMAAVGETLMGIIMRVVIAGVLGGVGVAILWVLFFTAVIDWPGHELFITVVFLFGALGTTMLSLKGAVW